MGPNGPKHPPVKGRLRERLVFWKDELLASSVILDTIEFGYPLQLLSVPPKYTSANDKSVYDSTDFVDIALTELLDDRCIARVSAEEHICSPLMVVCNNFGKKRLVINLKFLNKYLVRYKFKYDDIRTAMSMLDKRDYTFSFDLKSGYHHVEIRQKHQQYLGFAW